VVASTGSSSGLAVVVEDVVAFAAAAAAVVVADVRFAAAADVRSAAAADVLSAAAAAAAVGLESFPKIGSGPIGRDLLSVAEPVQSWRTYIVGTVAASAEGYVICIVAAAWN